MNERVLVIGAAGQIGSELVPALREVYGSHNVYATDIKEGPEDVTKGGPFDILDVMDGKRVIHYIIRHKITQVYHLAAVLSGNAERIPVHAWGINMDSLMNVLEIAREVELKKVFWPSSIAVFGDTTPRDKAPQLTVTEPKTVYGISKLAGERWCEYYNRKYKLDIRSLRYPGLISYKTEPGGGTTDYAVEIFYDAVRYGTYDCFLDKDAALPMMFMEDAVQATIRLMEAPEENISVRSSYNIGGMSFSPEELAQEIKKQIPGLDVYFKPDFRQDIANSWPASIDDSIAKKDWGLKYKYNLEGMTKVMLKEVKKKFRQG